MLQTYCVLMLVNPADMAIAARAIGCICEIFCKCKGTWTLQDAKWNNNSLEIQLIAMFQTQLLQGLKAVSEVKLEMHKENSVLLY